MPIFRNKKGEVSTSKEEKTRPLERNKSAAGLFEDDAKTSPIAAVSPASNEGKTRVNFNHRIPKVDSAMAESAHDAMDNPVIGWLVIIKGPGQGHALPLGYGQNSLGRNHSERVCLNFGDEEISREQHCMITYDPRGRKYYISNGSGTNLAYLNEAPVLAPTELTGAETIGLGQTQCRFVPLCGAEFDWQDVKD